MFQILSFGDIDRVQKQSFQLSDTFSVKKKVSVVLCMDYTPNPIPDWLDFFKKKVENFRDLQLINMSHVTVCVSEMGSIYILERERTSQRNQYLWVSMYNPKVSSPYKTQSIYFDI